MENRLLSFMEFSNPSDEVFIEIRRAKPVISGTSKIFGNLHQYFVFIDAPMFPNSYRCSKAKEYLCEKNPLLEKGLVKIMTDAYFKGKSYGEAINENLQNLYEAYVIMHEVATNQELFS